MTFLGWKTNLKCDDWNGKDLAAGSCGQQTLLAKNHDETIFWSTSIPNFKKGITIILIRQSLRSLMHEKRNLHLSSFTIHANIFLTCFFCAWQSVVLLKLLFSALNAHSIIFRLSIDCENFLWIKKFRLSTLDTHSLCYQWKCVGYSKYSEGCSRKAQGSQYLWITADETAQPSEIPGISLPILIAQTFTIQLRGVWLRWRCFFLENVSNWVRRS